MGSFQDTVTSLLGTYTKCLGLLKGSSQQQRGSLINESQSQLGRSIRSDRAKVRRVYSSKLSKSGVLLDEGDATARKSLRRIIRRLTTAMDDVVRTLTGRESQSLNYDTFVALSNTSHLDAIRTINDLSERVGSRGSSRSSVISHRSSRSGTSTNAPKKSRSRGSVRPSSAPKHAPKRRKRDGHEEAQEHRISIVTMSSDSTKLGEVRRRGERPWTPSQPIRVTYPLHHHHRPERREKKKWWAF